MRTRWLLIGLSVVLLGGAVFWFWSLGSVDVDNEAGVAQAVEYDGFVGGLRDTSENAHVFLAGKQSSQLRARYVGRRLSSIMRQIKDGESGLALQSLTSIEQDFQTLARSADDQESLSSMRVAVSGMQAVLADELPASPLYRLKQRLEDDAVLLAGADKGVAISARLSALDARLHEAESLMAANALEEMGLSLDAVRQGGQNVERDINTASGVKSEARAAAVKRLAAIRGREQTLRGKLALQIAPVATPQATEVAQLLSAPASLVTATGTRSGWAKLAFTATPFQLALGETARLRVIGTTQAGARVDLTATTRFSLPHGGGRLEGASVTPLELGALRVEATVDDGAETTSTVAVLSVIQSAALTGIELVPTTDPVIAAGDKIKLSVKASYDDGSYRIVTSEAHWTLSDAKLGALRPGMFSAAPDAVGPVVITAAYSENKVVKQSQIVVTVR